MLDSGVVNNEGATFEAEASGRNVLVIQGSLFKSSRRLTPLGVDFSEAEHALMNRDANFAAKATGENVTIVQGSAIELIVVDNQLRPVRVEEAYQRLGQAVDGKLVDLLDSGELPRITCSAENGEIRIGVDDEKDVSFVNEALKDIDLSTISSHTTF